MGFEPCIISVCNYNHSPVGQPDIRQRAKMRAIMEVNEISEGEEESVTHDEDNQSVEETNKEAMAQQVLIDW